MGGLAGSTIIVVVRLFVAVWPPAPVVDALGELSRPIDRDVRWTTPEQWHVTLRFLGSVEDVSGVRSALRDVSWSPSQVDVGPATTRLGPSVLVLPVRGLDALARALPFELEEPYVGHLTLARARRGRIPSSLTGVPFEASWIASSFSLVRSTTKPSGAVYDDVEAYEAIS